MKTPLLFSCSLYWLAKKISKWLCSACTASFSIQFWSSLWPWPYAPRSWFFCQICKLVRSISVLSLKIIPWSVSIFWSLKSILRKLYTHSAETVACTWKRCITNLLIMIFLIKWRNDDDSTFALSKDIDDNVKNVLRRLQPWPLVQSSSYSFRLFGQPCATLVSNLVKFGCILSTWSNTELWLKTNTQTNTHSHFHE